MVAAYRIGRARRRDLDGLAAIELAAAALLAGHAPAAVLAEASELAELDRARRDGHLWVARAGDQPVGFARVEMLGPRQAHLEEVDVHPRHGRRGIGAALVRTVCAWAVRCGHAQLTLTTFRQVAFNMPFYARLGFEVVPRARLSAPLAALVREEAARGLDPAARVVMRYARLASEVPRRRERSIGPARRGSRGACDADT
jgi:GNAT superfamily N-acetyltransferase